MATRDARGRFIKGGAGGDVGNVGPANTNARTDEVRIDLEDLEALQATFIRAANVDPRPLLDDIGAQQEEAARTRIARTKVSPAGTPWAPWSTPYAKTRGQQHSLLEEEGDLAESLTHVVDAGGGRGFAGASVDVGSNLEYAAAHLYGVPERNLPARPFLDTDGVFADANDRAEIQELITAFISDALGAQ